MGVRGRDLVAYILWRMGCQHPFVFSRILLLAELEYLKRTGERLTELRYAGGPGTFFIEGLKEMIESDPCFVKHEGDPATGKRGCIEYRCEVPDLPRDVKDLLDEIIDRAKGVNDMELNRMVLEHPLYSKVVAGVG